MVIAAHIGGKPGKNSYLLAALSFLSVKYPADRFIIFSEYTIAGLSDNCKQVPVIPKPKNKLLLYYWYNYKLPALLIKYNAEAFVSDAGMISMKTILPQYLYFHNNVFEKGRNAFFKKIFRQSLANAKAIFTSEDFIKDDLSELYAISAGKIQTVFHGIPVAAAGKESPGTEENIITEGSYYLYPVSAASTPYLLTILKAFSQLKKRQKTSMKLVLLLHNLPGKEMIPDLKNYRFRDDVIVKGEHEGKNALIQNAFGLIWFCNYDHAEIAFAALKYGVPLIAAENKLNRKLFGDAALFTDVSENRIAEKLQLLYKDENVRSVVLKNAESLTGKYDAARAADQLRTAMMP